ncbi:MAG: GntR family transcriptional regulator [Alphaproteobacteria bacterium]|nr:GntR family transcriptional regulator [Alphaproteobacteria bacterium]
MTIEAAKQKSTTTHAVDSIRSLIFSGELAAGTDHLESELAERLGISRTPVREATLMLAQQGLLEVRPRKGVRICALSVKDMEEVYAVLTELESLAAEDAARMGYSTRELASLKSAIDSMDRAIAEQNLEDWATADDQFHHELVRLGGNSRVQAIVTMMSDQVRRARSITLHIRPLPVKSNEDHRELYEAIKRGDPLAAREIHRRHRSQARELLVGILHRHRLSFL